MGSKGGYIPSGLLPGQLTTTMQGSYNGWQKSLTGTNIPPPGAGHLVYYSSTDDASVGQDFLYRKSVPGNPQLNTMETALNMGDNDIDDAGNVNAATLTATGSLSAATANVTGTVTAAHVTVPGGNNLQVGNSYYYGDDSNSAVRQNGAFHVQHLDGTAADIAAVGNITSSGAVGAASVSAQYFSDSNNTAYYVDPDFNSRVNGVLGNFLHSYGNVTSDGHVLASGEVHGQTFVSNGGIYYGVSNNWGMQLLDAGWGGNAAPQSAVGSAHVNDIFIRSVGKWVSEIAAGNKGTMGIYMEYGGPGGPCAQGNPYTGGCSCPAGSLASGAWVANYTSFGQSYQVQCYKP